MVTLGRPARHALALCLTLSPGCASPPRPAPTMPAAASAQPLAALAAASAQPPAAPAETTTAPPSLPSPAPVEAPPAEATAAAPPAASDVRMFRGRSEDEWLQQMSERAPLRVRARFHSTMYVFHIELEGGVAVSFQPARPGQEHFWRHEIVSYHLARLLGISNRVPPTVGRRFAARAFGRHLDGTGIVVDRNGTVAGSASVWMPSLASARMHLAPARRVWSSWMNPANPLPDAYRERARQVSEVLVFDFLAANYDRWNCCNITVDEHDDLVFRDNDAGWVPSVINRVTSPSVVRRVPRYLFEAVQRVTPEMVRDSVARDPMAREHRLVDPEALAGYGRRREALLQQLRGNIARHGEAAVLAWP